MTLDEKIAVAERHVASGRLVVERKRAIVARHRMPLMPLSIELLERFERTLQLFEMTDLLNRK